MRKKLTLAAVAIAIGVVAVGFTFHATSKKQDPCDPTTRSAHSYGVTCTWEK